MLQILLWNFVVFSFLGWLCNAVKSFFIEKRFINRAFLTLPFCPMYGLAVVICYAIMKPFSENLFILFACSMLTLSSIVIFFRFFINNFLGFRPSGILYAGLTFRGFASIFSVFFLGVAGFLLVGYIIPKLNNLFLFLPESVRNGLVYSLFAMIMFDYIFTLITTKKLKNKIKELSKTSQLFYTPVSQEKLKQLNENYNLLYTDSVLRRDLLRIFPDFKKSSFAKRISDKTDTLIKNNMHEYKKKYDKKAGKPFAYGLCFTKLFYIFISGCVLGSVFETIWCVLTFGHFEVRTALVYGPFIPVYGFGASFLTMVLYKLYKLNDVIVFVTSAVVGAGFEYLCSLFQEKAFGTFSWDYSDSPFNIEGRTNLMYALIWGVLGLLWVRILYPFFSKVIEKIPKISGSVITAVLVAFMVFDMTISCAAVHRWQQRKAGSPAINSYERFLDKNFDDEYMEWIFPHMYSI